MTKEDKEDRAAKREQWRALLEEFGSQEQTVDSFCTARGVKFYTFKYWQKIFKQESAPSTGTVPSNRPRFRELSISTSSSASSMYTILLRSGRTLSVGASFNQSELRKLIEILESC